MVSTVEYVAAVTSTITRLSAYVFLRWIPGHHFPPLILASTAIYLYLILGKSDAFGSGRPTLREAFPSLFKHEKQKAVTEKKEEIHEDEPVFYHDEKSAFKTLLLGIPEWHEWEFSYITIIVNVLLALMTLDLVFRGPFLNPLNNLSFSRVGHVDSTSAKILFREPDSKNVPVYVYYKVAEESSWTSADTIYYLGKGTDYTYPVTLSGLTPDTTYLYTLSNDLSGNFTTASSAQSSKANKLTFLTTSCIIANFPYRPFSNSLAIHGFEHLSKTIQALPSLPSFMLFLGDFIYVDVPMRLSSAVSHYRAEYRRVYASPSWKLPGISAIPWIHTLDDHEIANDWSGGNETAPFPAASDPFVHYHVSVNPPVPPTSRNGPETNTTYFQFSNGPASFFMLDTRRYRTRPEPASQSTSSSSKPLYGSSSSNPTKKPQKSHSMLGDAQLASLLLYLRTPEPAHIHWKFIASSVPFTKNWRFGTPDTWGGYLSERQTILDAMHAAERTLGIRVIILSGDRHEFAAVRFPSLAPSLTSASSSGPHEFSVGPLSMFYLPIRTFKQVDDQDVTIAYFPDGNSKVGVVALENFAAASSVGQRSLLRYSLWIDGNVVWEYSLTSPAVGYQAGAKKGSGLFGFG